MATTETKSNGSGLRSELEALRDKVRLELHLAGMDAKQEWEGLERELRQVEDRLRAKGEEATSATRERAQELGAAIHGFIDRHLRREGGSAPVKSAPPYGQAVRLEGTSMDEAMGRVTEALASEGFGILTQIDVQATMKKKLDVDMRPYLILGACNPALAKKALDADPYVGLLLPCNVVVQHHAGAVEVSALSPKAMLGAAQVTELVDVAEEAEERIGRVMARLSIPRV